MRKLNFKFIARTMIASFSLAVVMLFSQTSFAQNTLQKGNSVPTGDTDASVALEVSEIQINGDVSEAVSYVRSKIDQINQGTVSFQENEESVRLFLYRNIASNSAKFSSAEELVESAFLETISYNYKFVDQIDMSALIEEVDNDLQ